MQNHLEKQNIVIDTNILISAMLSETSVLNVVLEQAFEKYTVCLSEETLAEFVEVASREKFLKYFKSVAYRDGLISQIKNALKIIDVVHDVRDCRDPKDNKFLSLALSVKAVYLVSGDKRDLIAMNPYHGIEIITAREFLQRHETPSIR